MIDISLGKALVPVEHHHQTDCFCTIGCYFENKHIIAKEEFPCSELACRSYERKDGKNVIFKLVDYPSEYCKHPMKMCSDDVGIREAANAQAEMENTQEQGLREFNDLGKSAEYLTCEKCGEKVLHRFGGLCSKCDKEAT